ncbi:helix-turn-helix domain-containing protein [Staphylococcus pseudintermedius]|uniref:helix-turn-helix domain-containing protein n=2 Tax=Staphylococcus pseudintermedius TaxID=283734 RepID=UPI00292E77B4|nr:helix-turn-helix transcriptional regulator [Staphylococcus pseudintermedius]
MIVCTLNRYMIMKNKTQSEVAEATGITRPTLLSLIRNENKSVKYETVESLCQYFQVSMYDLLLYYPESIKLIGFDISLVESEYYISVDFNIQNKKIRFEESFNIEESTFINKFGTIELFAFVDNEVFKEIEHYNAKAIFFELMYLNKQFVKFQNEIYKIFNDNKDSSKKHPYIIELRMLPKKETPFEKAINDIKKLSNSEKEQIIDMLENN